MVAVRGWARHDAATLGAPAQARTAVFADMFGKWLAPPVDPWRVILTATLPFWVYLTVYDIIIYESYVLGGMLRRSPCPNTPFGRS